MAAATFPRVRTITPAAEVLFFALICLAAAIWSWASSHQRKPWQWTSPIKQPAWDTTYERPKPMPPAQPVIQPQPVAVPTPTRMAMKLRRAGCRRRKWSRARSAGEFQVVAAMVSRLLVASIPILTDRRSVVKKRLSASLQEMAGCGLSSPLVAAARR